MAQIKLNSSGMAELLKSAGVRAMLTARAEKVLASARATAPVATGAYKVGLTIQHATTDRAAVRVAGTAPHSHLVEANHGTLARALDSA